MRANIGRALALVLIGCLVCLGVYASISFAPRASAQTLTDQQKAQLQAQYDELQQEIAQWQTVLDQTKAKKASLQGDVTTLNAQIAQAQAEIKQRTITITTLGNEINQKNAQISDLEDSISQGHESLAKLLRQMNETETESLVVLAFSADNLSDFLSDVDNINSINTALQSQFNDIRNTQAQVEIARDALSTQQNAQIDAEHDVEVKKTQIQSDQTQKKQLLAVTTQNETTYSQILAQRQAQAAAIRAALFPLRDAAAINFGTALTYAQAAQQKTGVDPAFVLAILTQESNLGANVGQCYLTNDTTGAGVRKDGSKSYTNVMNPTRDVPPFLALANQLGFDPHQQVVSCPIPSAGGWGGAMGPAQFIASTWATMASKVATARGESVANPWDPQDAIMAMSLYLGNLGASAGTYSSERTAAAKYYAGGAWATAGQTYASQVMAKVDSIQTNINCLNDNSTCSI
ncbi:MAG TPA: lytic murein transglycosylase [Candidatus Paceibacterota bacterium]|nr:lytic murein transglycosylase [Candidatus Paceibacterota bacterium]